MHRRHQRAGRCIVGAGTHGGRRRVRGGLGCGLDEGAVVAEHFAAEARGGFEIEEVVGAVEPGVALGLVELAVGVFLFERGRCGGGNGSGGLAVLLEGEHGFGEAREGVEHAQVFVGVVFELFFAHAGAEVTELLANLSEGHLEAGEGELGGIDIGDRFGEGFQADAEGVAPAVFFEPIGIAALAFPIGDVVEGDVWGVVAEFGFDVKIRDTVIEHLVELVANGFGEAEDFAAAAAIGGVRLGGEGDYLSAHKKVKVKKRVIFGLNPEQPRLTPNNSGSSGVEEARGRGWVGESVGSVPVRDGHSSG